MENGLIYIPGGWLPGVPARDLTADEVEKYGGRDFLLASGRYKEPEGVKKIEAPKLASPKKDKEQ
jgi:hypothetical protein